MTATSISKLFLEYINYNYLLGGLFAVSIGFYLGKSFCSDRKIGMASLVAIIFLLLTVFNPLFFNYLSQATDSGATYYRFIWVLPLITASSSLLTEIVGLIYYRLSASKRYVAVMLSTVTALTLCAVIAFSGTSYLSPQNLTFPENKFNISRATLDISQFIQDDPDHQDGDVILAPTEIMMELLAYDITIVPALPRTEYINYKKEPSVYEPLLSLILEGPSTPWHHFENVRYNLNSLNVEYVVTLTLFDLDFYMENAEYYVYNRTGDYTLYKRGH